MRKSQASFCKENHGLHYRKTTTGGGTAGVLLVGCYWLVNRLLTGFAAAMSDQRTDLLRALQEQRQDFRDELATIRGVCLKASANAVLVLLLLIAGCQPGQGGEAGAFRISAFGGTFSFQGWTVNDSPPCTRPAQRQ